MVEEARSRSTAPEFDCIAIRALDDCNTAYAVAAGAPLGGVGTYNAGKGTPPGLQRGQQPGSERRTAGDWCEMDVEEDGARAGEEDYARATHQEGHPEARASHAGPTTTTSAVGQHDDRDHQAEAASRARWDEDTARCKRPTRFMEEPTRCRDHEHRQHDRARLVEVANKEEFIASDDEEDDDEEREQHWKRVADQGEGHEQGEEGSPSATTKASILCLRCYFYFSLAPH